MFIESTPGPFNERSHNELGLTFIIIATIPQTPLNFQSKTPQDQKPTKFS